MFKQATRNEVKLRMALLGPAGSGKTLSALLIARGLVGPAGRIGVIDTENNTASLYSGKLGVGEFQTAAMNPPYLVNKYIQAVHYAEEHFDVIIVDSLSHAWAGEGGILEQKTAVDSRGGNSFTNWAKFTPEQNQLISAVLHSKIHIIATMRTKTEYVLEDNDKGKKVPRKVGMAPVQRDGFEYEFDIILDIAQDHSAHASKDRTGLFEGQFFKPSNEIGKRIFNWIPTEVKEEVKNEAPANLR